MKTQNEYIPVAKNLSLTVRKEHRLMVVKKVSAVMFRMSWKIIAYALLLTIANVII